MRRPNYAWRIFRGELIRSQVRLLNPDSTPVNLTGCTLTVRPSGGPISASISDALQGIITVELSSPTVGRYPYEFSLRWPDSQEWMILHGSVLVEEEPYAE